MDNKVKLITDAFGREKFKFDEPISNHSVLRVGGKAKLFFVATTAREIIRIVTEARNLKVPLIIIGTGSKMMVSDNGFEGLIIKNRTKNINVVGVKGKVSKTGIGVEEAMVEAESGLSLKGLVDFLDKQGLLSDEFRDIPGTIGGNLFLSINLRDKTQAVKVLDEYGEVIEIKVNELNLRKHIILSAVFKFRSIL